MGKQEPAEKKRKNNNNKATSENKQPEVKTDVSDQSDDSDESKESSPKFGTDEDVQVKRKREREQKSKHEKKRRIKFNEQLALLRSLLCAHEPDSKKLSREYLLNAAIQEIAVLREKVEYFESSSNCTQTIPQPQTYFSVLETICIDWSDKSLSDLLPHSVCDLEKTFQIAFTREFRRFMDINTTRTESNVLHTIRVLEDMSNQIGKLEYQLSAGMLEQMYHITLKFNPKEYIRCLKKNWSIYQSIKKSARENLILYFGGEVGPWLLTEMSLIEHMTGNTEASERTYGFAKQLCKKFAHQGTNHFMLANLGWNCKGIVSVSTAERINTMLKKDYFWEPMGLIIKGRALIAAGRHKEGLEDVEYALTMLVDRIGEAADVFMAPALLDAYVQTRSVDKGIWIANYLLNKCTALNIEGMLGKEEILRQKANLLIMKIFPDFIPEAQLGNYIESSIQEILMMADQQFLNNNCASQVEKTHTYNPIITQAMQNALSTYSECFTDDVELLFQAAINMAHTHELYTVELWCCVDMARFFLHCGERARALEAAQMVKTAWAKMKSSEHTRDFQRARTVISMAELA